MTRLHRIQNSVWAGELTRLEWEDLHQQLHAHAGTARLQAWIFHSPPTTHHYGTQTDQQSTFL